MSVLSLSLKTVVDPASHHHEIVVATGVLQESVSLSNASTGQTKPPRLAFSMVRCPPRTQWPAGFESQSDHTMKQSSELALLNCLVAKVRAGSSATR